VDKTAERSDRRAVDFNPHSLFSLGSCCPAAAYIPKKPEPAVRGPANTPPLRARPGARRGSPPRIVSRRHDGIQPLQPPGADRRLPRSSVHRARGAGTHRGAPPSFGTRVESAQSVKSKAAAALWPHLNSIHLRLAHCRPSWVCAHGGRRGAGDGGHDVRARRRREGWCCQRRGHVLCRCAGASEASRTRQRAASWSGVRASRLRRQACAIRGEATRKGDARHARSRGAGEGPAEQQQALSGTTHDGSG